MTTTIRHDVAIGELFCQGTPFDRVVSMGQTHGWSRDDVLAVLKDCEWDLDGSGRLPRSKRLTTPAGLRNMQAAAPAPVKPRSVAPPREAPGPHPVPAVSRRTPIDHGTSTGYFKHYRHKVPIDADDSCGCRAAGNAYFRDQAAKKKTKAGHATSTIEPAPPAPTPAPVVEVANPSPHVDWDALRAAIAANEQVLLDARTERVTTPPAIEPERPVALDLGVECDVWFAEAQRSPSRRVQRAARNAIAALLAFRGAMDDLAREQRASSSRTTGEPT